jgi:hypothetical protein
MSVADPRLDEWLPLATLREFADAYLAGFRRFASDVFKT